MRVTIEAERRIDLLATVIRITIPDPSLVHVPMPLFNDVANAATLKQLGLALTNLAEYIEVTPEDDKHSTGP